MSFVRGVIAPRIASSSAVVITTRAPLAYTGPVNPKCSWSVVITSSSGVSPKPASTIPQPRVVESTRAM